MDSQFGLPKHNRKEREYKNDESAQPEQWDEKRPRISHSTWYAIIGVVLFAITGVAVIGCVVMIWDITW